MAFGRQREADDEVATQGRYVVAHVPVMVSGKKLLQQELDKGEAQGYSLRSLLMSDKHDWILVVWDRGGTSPAPPS